MSDTIVLRDGDGELHRLALAHAILVRAAAALPLNGRSTIEHPTLNDGAFEGGTRKIGSWLCTPDSLPAGFDDATSRHLETVHLVVDVVGQAQRVGVFSNDSRAFCLTAILRSAEAPRLDSADSTSAWLLAALSDLATVQDPESPARRNADRLLDRCRILARAAGVAQGATEIRGHIMLPTPTETGDSSADDYAGASPVSIHLPADALPDCAPHVIVNAFEFGGAEGKIGSTYVEWRRHLQMTVRPIMMTWESDFQDPLDQIRAMREAQALRA